jgi:hypothetical protein
MQFEHTANGAPTAAPNKAFKYREAVLRRLIVPRNTSAAGPNKNANVMPTRFASSQFTVVRHTRVGSGMVRSTGYTPPNVNSPDALIAVPAWYRFTKAGYRESPQKIPAITTSSKIAKVRVRHPAADVTPAAPPRSTAEVVAATGAPVQPYIDVQPSRAKPAETVSIPPTPRHNIKVLVGRAARAIER